MIRIDRRRTNLVFHFMNRMKKWILSAVVVDLTIVHNKQREILRSYHGVKGLILSLKLYSDDFDKLIMERTIKSTLLIDNKIHALQYDITNFIDELIILFYFVFIILFKKQIKNTNNIHVDDYSLSIGYHFLRRISFLLPCLVFSVKLSLISFTMKLIISFFVLWYSLFSQSFNN